MSVSDNSTVVIVLAVLLSISLLAIIVLILIIYVIISKRNRKGKRAKYCCFVWFTWINSSVVDNQTSLFRTTKICSRPTTVYCLHHRTSRYFIKVEYWFCVCIQIIASCFFVENHEDIPIILLLRAAFCRRDQTNRLKLNIY